MQQDDNDMLPAKGLVPPHDRPLRVTVVDFWHPPQESCIRGNHLFRYLCSHLNLDIAERTQRPDAVIYSCFGNSYELFDCMRICYLGENLRPNHSTCDYSLSFDPDSDRNVRLPLWRLYFDALRLILARRPTPATACDRSFCNFLYSNPNGSERNDFFHALSAYKHVNSGGGLFNNTGAKISNKHDFLAKHKFTIAFENSCHPGYTTEKMTEALAAGTVPIYWGNPTAHIDFDPRCYINAHAFTDMAALVEYVEHVDSNDDLYMQYLNAPAFTHGRRAIDELDTRVLSRLTNMLRDAKHPRVATSLPNRLARLRRRVVSSVRPGHHP